MRLFDLGLRFYRKTLKHVRPVHVAVHWLMTAAVIPLLERRRGFRTMPDDPFWFRLELLLDRHEHETVQQIDRVVKPGMTVLDVGAHVGYYTRRCARRVGPQGRVIAFEPHPRTFAVLQQNVQDCDNVTPLQLAVAEAEGTAELYDYLMMSASGSLHYDETMLELQKSQLSQSDVAPRIADNFPVQTFSVKTRPIDACLADLDIAQVDVVKMDIEGAEIGALRGMTQAIRRSPGLVLVMEYNPQALKAFDFEPAAALDEIRALGFQQVAIIEPDGTPTDLSHDQEALTQLTTRLMENMGVVNLLLRATETPPDPAT
jgi:FkbM family methyltransferase